MMTVTGHWITDAATQRVCAALTSGDYQALFVGGCVRNALLGVPVSDIDIATDATPVDILRCAQRAQIKAIPTGIEHGTITLVAGGIPHEITTFRSDVETDGRHAKVRFSKSVKEDAARRDFTMNAIYARPDGSVIDPLDGLSDLRSRHLRFIGDANARIREDYLRSLRFFRFTAWYGDSALGINEAGLAAVAQNLDGLNGLSRERVSAELKKLLAAADPAPAVAAMRSSGVLNAVLGGADDRGLAPLVHHEQMWDMQPDPMRRFAVLSDVCAAKGLRLSKSDTKRWSVLRDEVGSLKSALHLGYQHGAALAQDVLILRAVLLETVVDQTQFEETNKGETQVFPIKAKDLKPLAGQELGSKLRSLEARWIASNFTLSREELLS
jgi:poly(A) polymerase